MNLNTFARHGVFENKKATEAVAAKLRDANEVRRAKALPYQLMAAYLAAGSNVPEVVRRALEQAMEAALANVPRIDGRVYVCADVSGSMSSPVTGFRAGATSKMRCIDVAALVAAAFLRVNDAEVLPFEHQVVSLRLNRRDTVMTNAAKLASIGGGGTSCSAPLAELNRQQARGELVIFVSDNESWVDTGGHGTAVMREWSAFRARNPAAKLVCIDLQPNRTTQAPDDASILNIGGFSDAVFDVVAAFVAGGANARHWVDVIESIEL
jgi:60 kDa SS-A/Ro ribonucleoprotein